MHRITRLFAASNSEVCYDYEAPKCKSSILTVTDGLDAARNLHLATWSALTMDESSFTQVDLANRAELLTRRLSKLISPLLGTTKTDKATAFTSCWGKSEEDAELRLGVVAKLFKWCLQLKAKLQLRNAYFEIYIPVVGTPFDDAIMEESFWESEISADDAIVLCCTAPAVIAYDTKNVGSQPSQEDLLDLDKCIRGRHQEHHDGVVVSKAKVVLMERGETG